MHSGKWVHVLTTTAAADVIINVSYLTVWCRMCVCLIALFDRWTWHRWHTGCQPEQWQWQVRGNGQWMPIYYYYDAEDCVCVLLADDYQRKKKGKRERNKCASAQVLKTNAAESNNDLEVLPLPLKGTLESTSVFSFPFSLSFFLSIFYAYIAWCNIVDVADVVVVVVLRASTHNAKLCMCVCSAHDCLPD